jgi:DNA-directed RNA polymerase specialized sigma subunit
MDIVDDLRDLNSMHTPKEVSDIGEKAADEIERLRSQMDLFDPSTTQEMAAAALNFANDEIKRLQERNHALRKALQLIAAPSKVVVKGEEAVVALRLVLSSHRRTALKALGDVSDVR